MKILLLGKNGQVGWELQRSLAVLGNVVALGREEENGLCGDLADVQRLRETVHAVQPDAIVNAAAYTAVDRAESEPERAFAINAHAPRMLAEEAQRLDAWLLHYSTDYVFDGTGQAPWREGDATGPLSVYGASKLAGEQAIVESGVKHLILRTSWVYSARGHNFLKTMLRLGRELPELRVVDDQIGAPTGAELLADASAHALHHAALGSAAFSGTYHLAARGHTSWHAYASLIFERAQALRPELPLAKLLPIASAQYPTPAARPRNSRLNVSAFETTFDLELPPWQKGVERVVDELLLGA